MTEINVPPTYLPFHTADIGQEEIDAVADVLRSGWLTSGARAREFEESFAKAVGARYAVALNSGTAALHLALEAAGIGHGDEVIVPSMTFAASAEVVLYLGATPVFADCAPDTLTLRAEDIESVLTPRTKAVMPVHYGGHPCDMDPILDLARAHGLSVVEDAAHALPASYKGRPIGALGDFTAFSFYATKTLTTGEGGMLTTENEAWAQRAKLMSLHGISRNAWTRYEKAGSWRYDILAAGYKYNLTDIAAAIGLVQLRKLQAMCLRRREIAAMYDRAFDRADGVRPVGRRSDVEHAWHLYPVRFALDRLRIGRDGIVDALAKRDIGTSVHFIPLHTHPLHRGRSTRTFPNTMAAFDELVSLPIYSRMTDDDVARVAGAVTEIVSVHRR